MVRLSARSRRRCLIAAAAACLAIPTSAGPAGADAYVPLPTTDAVRTIQLSTLACGRDNKAEPCENARRLADPLLDHPRLSALCKDALWSIRQRAVVDPSGNTLARRDPIDRAANDAWAYCRPKPRPKDKPSGAEGSPAQSGGGFGFSGGQPQR